MLKAGVLTVSDRSAAGTREDTAGPIAVSALREAGFDCAEPWIVADGAAAVEQALRSMLADGLQLIITTGGTGVGPRDRTPEGTAAVLDLQVPGVADELRRRGVAGTPMAMLSRGLAGVAGAAFVVNLPGSPNAVAEGMPVVLSVATHVLTQLAGGDHR